MIFRPVFSRIFQAAEISEWQIRLNQPQDRRLPGSNPDVGMALTGSTIDVYDYCAPFSHENHLWIVIHTEDQTHQTINQLPFETSSDLS